jgi:aspartyl-tRNA(Asn)/glutamyl-tRNA(Gln) amidotransferase subunit A
LLATAEASSNLSRYAGMHYGYRSKDATDLESTYKKSRSEGFGPEVKRRIMLGTFVLSEGYFDAFYTKAMKVRRKLRDESNAILSNYDAIVTPTAPNQAFKIGEKSEDPIQLYLADIFTVQANLTGHPAISVPFKKNSESGMPYGLQFITKAFEEPKLYSMVQQLCD